MADLWSDLLSCLELHGVPAGAATRAENTTVLEGRNQDLSYHRLFGGQLLGQFVRAACQVCPDKAVKSLHALFPKEGRNDELVSYEVVKQHEGRSFATLSVVARQSRGVIATASLSMHAPEGGLDRQTAPALPAVPGAEHEVDLGMIPWQTRTTGDLDDRAPTRPELDLWMRTPSVAAGLAPALLAYATDLTLIGTALRPLEGISQQDAGTAFVSAVTSHTLWFHRPFRTDSWLLLRQQSPVVAHGRCYGRGDVLTEGASLVASYAQEALLRFQH